MGINWFPLNNNRLPNSNIGIQDQGHIKSLVETYQRQYPDAHVGCIVADDGDIQIRNAALFKKALAEAVENAIEHTDQSTPEVTITVQRELDANHLRIHVADNGAGIPDMERQAIESGEETPLSHSLGIELWLMRWKTTSVGGELTITDNEPRGSVVTFRLPFAELHNG